MSGGKFLRIHIVSSTKKNEIKYKVTFYKVSNNVNEMWYYSNSKYGKLNKCTCVNYMS